ncbi:MAG: dockerin type I repeat-containing protein [Oscillospiraceae bacterium]
MKVKQINIVLLELFALFLASLCCPSLEAKAASGVDNITARSDYMYNTIWVPQRNVGGWWDGSTYRFANGTKWGGTFYQGTQYHLPYGQPITAGAYIGYGVTVGEFLAAASDPNNVFYSVSSYNQYNMPSNSTFYANDCSAFVSYCWGLPSRKTTYDWSGLNVTSLGLCNTTNIQRIQQGDAICKSAHHIVLISRVYPNGTYEVTEQTPPEMKRSVYSAAQLASNYGSYTIYRYNGRNGVLPPDVATPLPAPTTSQLSLSTNARTFAVNEPINLSVDSDTATGYTLFVCQGDTVVYSCELPSTLYTVVPPARGTYRIYVIAHNNGGQLQSNVETFNVYDAPPSNLNIAMRKTVYGIGENITFAFSSQDSLYYTFEIFDAQDNSLIQKTTQDSLYAVKFSKAGIYHGILRAYNELGASEEKRIDFAVSEHPVVDGDITGDSVLDTTDLQLLQGYLHKEVAFTEDNFHAADVTKDGVVNVIDLAVMKRMLHNQ